ncbi:MAG: S-layer homology domain-containing protein [Lysinibacillus sp.]
MSKIPMKSFITLLALLVVLTIAPQYTSAITADISGSVKNEYTYEEVVFISGKPVVFRGTSKAIKITSKESKGKLVESHNLKLTGDKGETLTRNFTYQSDIVDHSSIGQQTANGNVTKYSEKIVIDGVSYTLADYQFSQGTVTDNRPASDYYSGNVVSRKIYTVPGKRGQAPKTITVDSQSRHAGYENFWGATETQITESIITESTGGKGYVKNRLSTSKSRVLNYEENKPPMSSFDGGYAVVSEKDAISNYTYDIPYGAGKGEIDIEAEYMPTIERLIVPKFRDIANIEAKDAIEKLYSLGIYEDANNIFSPSTPMKRYDFTVAVAKAVDLRVLEEKSANTSSNSSIFKDVPRNKKDYSYFVSAVKKGIITGDNGYFNPDRGITRAQTATIFVRALGLENKESGPIYATEYADDANIPEYARNSVYIMNEIGLMVGDSTTNRFNPHKQLTRAQASLVFERFLLYLENDLKENYRDNGIFFD